MGTNKGSEISSYRRKWDKIFHGLVHMLQSQQAQLETLAIERKLLEDRIRVQHERWISDVRLYEDRISQMKGDLLVQEMTHSLEEAKSDFVASVKRREAFLENLKLEHAESELADFKAWLDYLSHKSSDPKAEEQCSKILEGEVRRLKHEYQKLGLEKSSEVSALLAEKNLLWNQYKILENDYSNKLRSNHSEVTQANETITKLLGNMEQLQSLNDKKDEMIARLRNKVTKMEVDTTKLNEETFRLSQELDLLKSSRVVAAVTPIINRCSAGAKPCLRAKNSGRSNTNVKKESSAAQVPDSVKENEKFVPPRGPISWEGDDGVLTYAHKRDIEDGNIKGSKRKGAGVISISDTPKLFSSNFKVPKLKTIR